MHFSETGALFKSLREVHIIIFLFDFFRPVSSVTSLDIPVKFGHGSDMNTLLGAGQKSCKLKSCKNLYTVAAAQGYE